MATFPPIHHPHDLPICPLPTDIYNDHDNYHLWSLLNPFEDEFTSYPLDLSILSDIADEPSGVDQLYPPPTDLVEMEVNPFQTPPTPEPEPDFIQKPEEIHGMSSQPQNNPSFSISSLTEGIKMEKKESESPCPMEIQREEPKGWLIGFWRNILATLLHCNAAIKQARSILGLNIY